MARNFLYLSPAFIKALESRKRKMTPEVIGKIFGFLGDEYQPIVPIAEMVTGMNLETGQYESVRLWIYIVRDLRRLLMANEKEREEIWKEIGKKPYLRTLSLAWEKFQKDGLVSWKMVEKAFEKPDKREELASSPTIPEITTGSPQNGATNSLGKLLEEFNQKMRDLFERTSRDLASAKSESDHLREKLDGSSSELEEVKSKLASANDKTALQEKEIEALKEEIEIYKSRTPDALAVIARELQEGMARLVNLEEGIRGTKGDAKEDKLSGGGRKNKFSFSSLPHEGRWGESHFRVIYTDEFREQFEAFGRNDRKALVAGIRIVCNQGSQYNSLKAENVKESRIASIPKNATMGWAGLKLRMIWKLTDQGLVFYACYHKNNCPAL